MLVHQRTPSSSSGHLVQREIVLRRVEGVVWCQVHHCHTVRRIHSQVVEPWSLANGQASEADNVYSRMLWARSLDDLFEQFFLGSCDDG